MNQIEHQDLISRLMKDRRARVEATSRSHYWFFHFYFSHYITFPTAPFQKEMFKLTEEDSTNAIVISAFRGSAKSSIMNLSYALWSILGVQKKKFVLILGQTQEQAGQHLKNIKEELERNELLRRDLGPFEEDREWRNYSLILPKYGAKIMARSSDQGIRGLRHGPYRPQLLIGDDLEDWSSVASVENRDKIHEWLSSEAISGGAPDAKLVVIGTILHEDCLLKRLQKEIELGKLSGIYKEYPLIDDNGKVLWPGRYPTKESIETEKKRIGNDSVWSREFLLKIVPNENRIVQSGWIKYYDELPAIENKNNQFRYAATGIDLAISTKSTADYTAMVSARIYDWDDKMRIYILPHPVNERIDFPTTVDKAKLLSDQLVKGQKSKLFIEDVGYQPALVQRLEQERYPAEGVKVYGHDKASRLTVVSHYIKQGVVLFPKNGAELLIQQLVGFGIEKHDDLADAFAILVNQIMGGYNKKPAMPEVFVV